VPDEFSGAEAADRDAVLQHVGDDVEFRFALDEAAAVLLHRGPVEWAKPAAVGDQVVVGQGLAAEQ
jgi:hypothetical protein